MKVSPLDIDGAWLVEPVQHRDGRGVFLESFRADVLLRETGRPFPVLQTNTSVSDAGVVRGVHFADVPPSQAKYVTCVSGAVLDVVVDIRVGSPTFGRWTSVLLDSVDRRAVLLSEGLGHAFMALEDQSIVSYLCTAPYAPGREHGVHPLDPQLAIAWPDTDPSGRPLTPSFSAKDEAAPTLQEALDSGLLPRLEDVQAFVASLT
ncbi:dTDP-4-dehydrorhamnose 3,5-epimerase family protein [Cellulomonas sp. P5_C6]